MKRFSGRISQIYPEIPDDEDDDSVPSMISVFGQFEEKFEISNFAFCFEHKDKSGKFDRDGHYHLLFNTTHKRDTMRRFLTSLGFAGPLASLHEIKDDHEYQLAVMYTFKHGDCVYTDLDDQLQQYLDASKEYQISVKPDIKTDILNNIINRFKMANPSRQEIAKQLYTEYYLINNPLGGEPLTMDRHYAYPNSTQLLRMIQYIESRTCVHPDISYNKWLSDNAFIIEPTKSIYGKLDEWKLMKQDEADNEFINEKSYKNIF